VTGDRARITIPFSHSGTAVRMISTLSGISEIVEPAEVRAEVVAFARRALDAYAQTS
jgi:hypothetical protein